MSSNQTKTNGDKDTQHKNDFVLNALPPAVRDFLEDEGQSSNLTYYNISRPEGSKLDILHQYSVNQNGGGEEQEESTLTKTIGICNIVSLAPFIYNGRHHKDTYLNAVSNALAIQHLNLGDGSIVEERNVQSAVYTRIHRNARKETHGSRPRSPSTRHGSKFGQG